MENKNMNNTKKIEITEIDMDSLGEAILACVANTKRNCKSINTQITKMATMSFVPWTSANEQYDNIVEKMAVKSELINLCREFKKWGRGLSEQRKKFFIAYFVQKDKHLCTELGSSANYHKVNILPMARSFANYLELNTDLKPVELLKNPFVYRFYVNTLTQNESFSRRGNWVNKGGQAYDCATNERCYSSCL